MRALTIESEGHGRDVVLLHGLPQSPEELAPLARAIAAAGYRTHLVHLPGYGSSAPVEGDHDLDAVADAVAEALRQRGIVTAAYLGMSAGFYRALQLACSPGAPRPWALVGLGPLAGLDEATRALFRDAADAVEARADLSRVLVERFLSPAFAAAHEWARAHVARMIDAASSETVAAELRAFSRTPDRLDDVRALDVPVYLRTGEFDVPAPPEVVRALASAAPRGRCDVVAGAGHLLTLEDHAATLAACLAALDGADA